MDDMKTFRELAERCFSIKPELRPAVHNGDVWQTGEPLPCAVGDILAAWALLCDLPNATIESTTESHAAFTNCCWEYACRCRTESGKWNGTAFTQHEAIARCWLAANGVQV